MSITIAKPLSSRKIEQYAMNIRSLSNCTDCYFDIISLIEKTIPKIDETFNFEYVDSQELEPNTYAYYDPAENTIRVAEDVYVRASNDVGRDRFTLAHEVGHYMLHRNGITFSRATAKTPIYCDPEWQANTFASALLIPRCSTGSMTIEQIQEECKVSHQAAEIAFQRNSQ